jgi:hypothetical protein
MRAGVIQATVSRSSAMSDPGGSDQRRRRCRGHRGGTRQYHGDTARQEEERQRRQWEAIRRNRQAQQAPPPKRPSPRATTGTGSPPRPASSRGDTPPPNSAWALDDSTSAPPARFVIPKRDTPLQVVAPGTADKFVHGAHLVAHATREQSSMLTTFSHNFTRMVGQTNLVNATVYQGMADELTLARSERDAAKAEVEAAKVTVKQLEERVSALRALLQAEEANAQKRATEATNMMIGRREQAEDENLALRTKCVELRRRCERAQGRCDYFETLLLEKKLWDDHLIHEIVDFPEKFPPALFGVDHFDCGSERSPRFELHDPSAPTPARTPVHPKHSVSRDGTLSADFPELPAGYPPERYVRTLRHIANYCNSRGGPFVALVDLFPAFFDSPAIKDSGADDSSVN